MAANYTGNPTAVQAPGVAPGPGILSVLSLPADTDGASWANLYQAFKVLADNQAFYANPNRVGQFRERWDIISGNITTQTLSIPDLQKRWSFIISAGATQVLTFNDPTGTTGNYPSRNIRLNQGTGNASQQSWMVTGWPIWAPPAVPYRCLLEFDLQPSLSTLNSREWHLGWQTGAASIASDNVVFYNDYTQANWQAQSNGLMTDTGVPVAIGNTWIRFAILIDTTLGTPSALYYINGNLVATRTVGLPAAGTSYGLQFGGRQLTTGTCAFTLGEVVATWTKF